MEDKRIKLLRNFILVSLPLIALMLAALILPMGYMSEEYVVWAEEWDYVNLYKHEASCPSTLIIGDSRAKSSIIPAKLSDKGDIYNIAIGGATPIEMYYASKNYIKKHEAPEKVYIIFAPYHLCDIDNWDQMLYNNYLSVSEISGVYEKALEYKDPVILKKGWITDSLSFRLRLPNKYLAQMYDARFVGFKSRNEEMFDRIRSEYGYCEFGSDPGNDGESYEVHHLDFDSSGIVLYYYEKLIELLVKNNVEVEILQAPLNETSSKEIHEEFVKGYVSYMEELEGKYENITVMKDIPAYDNKYFGDNNHLNRSGAEKYTDWLKGKEKMR